MGVEDLGKDTLDKGVVPTSGSSRSIPNWGTKDKGNKSVWLEGGQKEEVKRGTGWREMRAVCCQ